MSKGWTRRPTNLSRACFDLAWEQCFGKSGSRDADQPVSELGVVAEESGEAAPSGHPTADPSIPVEFGMHPCDVADTMAPAFGDQRGLA